MATILVVDDDAFLRGMVSEYLQKRGFVVTTARDGAEGVASIEESRPNLVVTDVRMPGNEEGKFIFWVRQHWPDIPVIVMSGMADDDFAAYTRVGCLGVAKPFSLSRLMDVVHAALAVPVGEEMSHGSAV